MFEKSPDIILCVDDEENMLHLFKRTLGRKFTLYTANSAIQALEVLQIHSDIAVILSDFSMPDINGVEFLKKARLVAPHSVHILLTGNIELDVAIKAINETEIFRYLPKPCPMEVVQKVITDALAQYHMIFEKQRLTRELQSKNNALAAINDALAKQKYLLEYELEMAKIVYTKVISQNNIAIDGLDSFIFAKDTVGGDFLLTHASEDQKIIYLMLGDLTGHGLQSALSVLLVNEIFDVLCLTHPSVEQLAESINDKMYRKLPADLFCAAFLIKLDLVNRQIYIWQGGMPDAYFLDAQGNVIATLASKNFPLGVISDINLTGTATCHNMDKAEALFLYSDGLIEQQNTGADMFGIHRLQMLLRSSPPGNTKINSILMALQDFQQDSPQNDDISLCEINFPMLLNRLENSVI